MKLKILLMLFCVLSLIGCKGEDMNWDLLDENCSGISDWVDNDVANGVSEVSPPGQFRFDANISPQSGINKASRKRTLAVPDDYTLEIKLYCDSIGTHAQSDYADVFVYNGAYLFHPSFCSDSLYIWGASPSAQGDWVKHNGEAAWQVWRFVVTAGSSPCKCDIYLDGSLMASDVEFEVSPTVDELVGIEQLGYWTSGMVSHVDYIKMASGKHPPSPPPPLSKRKKPSSWNPASGMFWG